MYLRLSRSRPTPALPLSCESVREELGPEFQRARDKSRAPWRYPFSIPRCNCRQGWAQAFHNRESSAPEHQDSIIVSKQFRAGRGWYRRLQVSSRMSVVVGQQFIVGWRKSVMGPKEYLN